MTWDDIANACGTDKGTADMGHGFMDEYERILTGRDVRSVLEIGVQTGASLHMWAAIWPDAQVVGVDCAQYCMQSDNGANIRVVMCQAENSEMLKYTVAEAWGPFDLIVDDGSHLPAHQRTSWAVLIDYVSDGGVYVIEDVALPNTLGIEGRLVSDVWAARGIDIGHAAPYGMLITAE